MTSIMAKSIIPVIFTDETILTMKIFYVTDCEYKNFFINKPLWKDCNRRKEELKL